VCAFVALDTPLGGRSASPLDGVLDSASATTAVNGHFSAFNHHVNQLPIRSILQRSSAGMPTTGQFATGTQAKYIPLHGISRTRGNNSRRLQARYSWDVSGRNHSRAWGG